MKKSFLHRVIRRFCGERDGSVMVETVICLPLLIWALVATYEFFEVFRYRSAREKATYTIADMISRETPGINDTYVDNVLRLFDGISNDDGVNQVRVSVLIFDAGADLNSTSDDEYSVRWSEVRGTGDLVELVNNDVRDASHSTLPTMPDGGDLILVESMSDYTPAFNVGLGDRVPVYTRLFTKPRFTDQVCYEGQYCYVPPS
ncbi:TadE/TadG family type IV pilus assembly protein [Roseovarius sp. CAU 1744]